MDPRQMQFWDDEESGMWDELSDILLEIYLSGTEGGVGILPQNAQVLVDFDLVNKSALDFARDYRYFWIKSITATTRVQVQQAVTDWISEGSPISALEARLTPIFGAARAGMIATTEVTRIYARANMDTWESSGVVSGGQWMTSQDESVCPICEGHDGETVGAGDVDAAPPAHVNCRCWLQPIVSEELFDKKLAEIFG